MLDNLGSAISGDPNPNPSSKLALSSSRSSSVKLFPRRRREISWRLDQASSRIRSGDHECCFRREEEAEDGGAWRRRTTPGEGVCGGGRRISGSMAGFLVNKSKVLRGKRKVS